VAGGGFLFLKTNRIMRILLALSLPTLLAAQAPTVSTKGSGTVVLKAARVIDGTGAAAIQNGVVVVTDDKIVAVGPAASVSIPAGARTVDLGNATLLPGFIDAHTHVIGRTLGDPAGDDAAVRDVDSFGAILGTVKRAQYGHGRIHDDPKRRRAELR
jgi:predicted amidohydrolase YtcJ